MPAKTSALRRGETWWGEPCLRVLAPLPSSSGFEWQLLVTYVAREGRLVVAEMTIHVPIPGHGHQLDPLFFAAINPYMPGHDTALIERVTDARDELPPRGLTSSDARANLSGIRDHAREALRWLADQGYASPLPVELPKPKAASAQQGRALGDEYFEQLAEDYLRVAATNPNRPQLALFEEYQARKVPDLTRKRLKGRIRLLVEHGWLNREAGDLFDNQRMGRLVAGPRLEEARAARGQASTKPGRKGKAR